MTDALPQDWWHVYDTVDRAEDEIDARTGTDDLFHALATTERLVGALPGSAEAHYLRGYVLHLCQVKGQARRGEALSEMRQALRLDPGHQWARFHEIVLCYDAGRYGAVLDAFARLDRAYFDGAGKDWRYVKAVEYRLCCLFRLGLLGEFSAGLPPLIDEYVRTEDDPDLGPERPAVLLALYQEVLAQGDTPVRDLLRQELSRLVPGHWVSMEELR